MSRTIQTTPQSASVWQEQFRQRAASLPGASLPWLQRQREQAIERFASLGWPSSRQEDWRHTSLSFLDQHELAVNDSTPHPASLLASLRSAFDDNDLWLVFVDGRYDPTLSIISKLPAGVEVKPLSALLPADEEVLQTAFDRVEDAASPYALNLALCSDGAVVRLASGSVLEPVLHLVFIGGNQSTDRHLRNLVIAGANSSASIIEHHLGGGLSLDTVVTRLDLGENAQLNHVKLQQQDERAIHVAEIDARQARASNLALHSLSFGAKLARHDIHTHFDGEGCDTLLNGLYHVDGRRHVDHHTLINHAHPRGNSREFFRGLVDDNARGVFRGRILVAKDAQRTDAVQRSDSLLLSKLAEADSRPELEIYADDVKCAHGATVGQIDEDALFYLRSRGLSAEHAHQLLTYAFAAEVIERIDNDALRKHARTSLLGCLPGGMMLEDLL